MLPEHGVCKLIGWGGDRELSAGNWRTKHVLPETTEPDLQSSPRDAKYRGMWGGACIKGFGEVYIHYSQCH